MEAVTWLLRWIDVLMRLKLRMAEMMPVVRFGYAGFSAIIFVILALWWLAFTPGQLYDMW
jgi:hypothetical protein